jgi:hypothetical protein
MYRRVDAPTQRQKAGDMGRQRKMAVIPDKQSPGWLASLDGRTCVAQDMAGRFDEICRDLGGADRLSYMQRSLIERALWIEYWLASQERELAEGREVDTGRYVQAANGLQGIFNRLGLERRARDVTPDLASYIAAKSAGQ